MVKRTLNKFNPNQDGGGTKCPPPLPVFPLQLVAFPVTSTNVGISP